MKSLRALFGAVIFLGAFLLFIVQPMIGKFILPFFGGTSQVWSVSLMFFMTLLLGGYIYADLLHRFPKRFQAALHLLIIVFTGLWIAYLFVSWPSPIMPGADWHPDGALPPALRVLMFLVLCVGIPFFLLSTTSSILQSWFSRIFPEASVYKFYVLSNLGSLLGLLSYPFLVEPFFTLNQQGKIWSWAFLIYGAGLSLCAMLFLKKSRDEEPETETLVDHDFPKSKQVLMWLGLSIVPAVLLLATTNKITQGVAPVPFLWLLPLGLYLLSFVFAFSGPEFFTEIHAVLLILSIMLLLTVAAFGLPFITSVLMFNIVLFLTALMCHSWLYRLRPDPKQLTFFYLVMSLGGALGGVFVGLIAPMVFPDFWELPLALFAAGVLAVLFLSKWFSRRQFFVLTTAVSVILIFTAIFAQKEAVKNFRNFYGVLAVKKQTVNGKPVTTLVNGRIVHGAQFNTDGLKRQPTTYYSETSGVGRAFQALRRTDKERDLRVGIVGLGAGTIAAYCQAGDYFNFYEINPQVLRIAKEDFSYLRDCPGEVEVTIGDARLSMEKELAGGKKQDYDLLVVDAFSDDAIPVHLLTRQSFQLYLNRLAAGGALAVHISNINLDLEPVVLENARHFGLASALIKDPGDSQKHAFGSNWFLLALDQTLLGTEEIKNAATDLSKIKSIRPWTDDFSNLFQVIRK